MGNVGVLLVHVPRGITPRANINVLLPAMFEEGHPGAKLPRSGAWIKKNVKCADEASQKNILLNIPLTQIIMEGKLHASHSLLNRVQMSMRSSLNPPNYVGMGSRLRRQPLENADAGVVYQEEKDYMLIDLEAIKSFSRRFPGLVNFANLRTIFQSKYHTYNRFFEEFDGLITRIKIASNNLFKSRFSRPLPWERIVDGVLV